MGSNLIDLVRQLFQSGTFTQHLTDTNIILISKKKCPSYMTVLRPISLYNVAHKVISKVLTNRLKKVIDGIIS